MAENDAVSKSTNGSKYGYGEAFQSEGLSHEFKASAGGKGSGSMLAGTTMLGMVVEEHGAEIEGAEGEEVGIGMVVDIEGATEEPDTERGIEGIEGVMEGDGVVDGTEGGGLGVEDGETVNRSLREMGHQQHDVDCDAVSCCRLQRGSRRNAATLTSGTRLMALIPLTVAGR